MHAPRPLLGEILIRRQVLSRQHIDSALDEQRNHGGRLGDILISRGDLSRFALYQAVADHFQLPFVDLLRIPPDTSLLSKEDAQEYVRRQYVPWKREGEMMYIATSEPGEIEPWLKERYRHYQLVVTSPYDIRRVVEQHFGEDFEQESRLRLFRSSPLQSARATLTFSQQLAFIMLSFGAAAAFYFAPYETAVWLLVLLNAMYGVVMLFKWGMYGLGKSGPKLAAHTDSAFDDKDLPVYTILVPMYREGDSLPYLIAAIDRLDYPKAKLDVKLVLEQDDEATYRAALAQKPGWHFDIVRVPSSQPRTKPKACNYALRFARGTYVTIFDAEDEPNPGQLKAALNAFRQAPPEMACLQARLNYYNADTNWLTRWFALEYAVLFDRLLPGLERAHVPIPLGGTSNHLSLAHLRDLGEWDPYNVTEDADLGIRLAIRGLKTAVLDSITLEEAPDHVGPWLRQRSRWIKGYMQTWLVHMRAPLKLWRNCGTRGFVGFQLFVGCSSLTYITAPFVWIFALLTWNAPEFMQRFVLPEWFAALCLFNLVLHLVAHWHQAFGVMRRVPGYSDAKLRFRLAAALFPFYWILHSAASYKALWQLVVRPHFWEKTTHSPKNRAITQ